MGRRIAILQSEASQRFIGLSLEQGFDISYVSSWDKAIELAQADGLDGFLFNLPRTGLARVKELPPQTRLFCIVSPSKEPPFIPQESPPLVFLPSPFSLLELRSAFRKAFNGYEVKLEEEMRPLVEKPVFSEETEVDEPKQPQTQAPRQVKPTGLVLSPKQFIPLEDTVSFSPIQNTVMDLVHTVKNPLVSIQTFAQMLPEKIDDEEFRESFSSFVNNELSVINGKLNHYLETISLPNVALDDFDLAKLLTQTSKTLAAAHPKMTTKIEVADSLPMHANQQQLKEAITILWSIILEVVKEPQEFSLSCDVSGQGVESDSMTGQYEINFNLKFKPQYIDMELDFLSTAKRSKGVEILHAIRLIEEMDGVLRIMLAEKECFVVSITLPMSQGKKAVTFAGR